MAMSKPLIKQTANSKDKKGVTFSDLKIRSHKSLSAPLFQREEN
jgi:hypothetical protein